MARKPLKGSPPPLGKVKITAQDPPLKVTALLAEDPPTITDGYGGWDVVERPRRAPLTTWKSSPARQLSLSILLDGWADGDTVEHDCGQVAAMGRPPRPGREPPQLRVDGLGGGMPGKGILWVVSALEWGAKLVNRDGNRVRQAVKLTLIEYVDDVYLDRSAARRRQGKAGSDKPARGANAKRVIVKAGDTLLSIAAAKLGDAKRWPELAKLNKIRDPRSLKRGQVIRLP